MYSIYDSNPYATRKNVSTASCPHIPWKAMAKETMIRGSDNPFDTDVVTSYPGLEVFVRLIPNDHDWDAVMFTEDQIVMMQDDEDDDIPGNIFAYMTM
ncbi:hypothetical protein V8B97DRAFT_1932475 [Scleroderma yunnanense]